MEDLSGHIGGGGDFDDFTAGVARQGKGHFRHPESGILAGDLLSAKERRAAHLRLGEIGEITRQMPDGTAGPLVALRVAPSPLDLFEEVLRQAGLAARLGACDQAVGSEGDLRRHPVQLHVARRIGGKLPHSPGRPTLSVDDQLRPEGFALFPAGGVGGFELHHPLLPHPQQIVDLSGAKARGVDQILRLQLPAKSSIATQTKAPLTPRGIDEAGAA